MVAVDYNDLLLAFEFVSSAHELDSAAYLSRDSGKIFGSADGALDDAELPDDIETSDQYIAIPYKNDLGLGRDLALRFVAEAPS